MFQGSKIVGLGRCLQQLDEFYSVERNWRESSGERLEELGDLFRGEDYPHRAAFYYEVATVVEPNRSTAHFKLGELSFLMGNYDRTKSALGNVLSVDPTYYEAHFNLGRANLKTRSLAAARRHLSAWLSMAKGSDSEEKVKMEWAEQVLKGMEKRGISSESS